MSVKKSASAARGAETDPVLLAVARAPVGLPETSDEKRLVAAARSDGRAVRASDVESMLAERARNEE
jgi:hypothetical protein